MWPYRKFRPPRAVVARKSGYPRRAVDRCGSCRLWPTAGDDLIAGSSDRHCRNWRWIIDRTLESAAFALIHRRALQSAW